MASALRYLRPQSSGHVRRAPATPNTQKAQPEPPLRGAGGSWDRPAGSHHQPLCSGSISQGHDDSPHLDWAGELLLHSRRIPCLLLREKAEDEAHDGLPQMGEAWLRHRGDVLGVQNQPGNLGFSERTRLSTPFCRLFQRLLRQP